MARRKLDRKPMAVIYHMISIAYRRRLCVLDLHLLVRYIGTNCLSIGFEGIVPNNSVLQFTFNPARRVLRCLRSKIGIETDDNFAI